MVVSDLLGWRLIVRTVVDVSVEVQRGPKVVTFGVRQLSHQPHYQRRWKRIRPGMPPERRKVVIEDGKAMSVIGVGSVNLRMHSNSCFDVKFTGVCVTASIGLNLVSLHHAQE